MHSTGLTDAGGPAMSDGGQAVPDIWRVIDSVTAEGNPNGSADETGSRHKKKWWRRQS